jgi:hypothetical protein
MLKITGTFFLAIGAAAGVNLVSAPSDEAAAQDSKICDAPES